MHNHCQIKQKEQGRVVILVCGSNEYTQSIVSRNMKNIRIFLFENFHFLVVKFSIYLNRCVLVMKISGPSCSKLTTSLVNDSLKFTLSDTQIC